MKEVVGMSGSTSSASIFMATSWSICLVELSGVFFVQAGSGPRSRTKRVKNDCNLSADYYNINFIIIYYIIIKVIIMENYPSQNQKRNSIECLFFTLSSFDIYVCTITYIHRCLGSRKIGANGLFSRPILS